MVQDQWRKLYRDAVIETDFKTLVERIDAAKNAIASRLSLGGEVTAEEQRDLHDSRDALLGLTEERTQPRTDLDGNE